MTQQTFQINDRIIDRTPQNGIPNLQIEFTQIHDREYFRDRITNSLSNYLNIDRQIERCPSAIGRQNRKTQLQPQTQTGAIARHLLKLSCLQTHNPGGHSMNTLEETKTQDNLMQTALRIKTEVLPGNKIEITLPANMLSNSVGTTIEVIVLLPDRPQLMRQNILEWIEQARSR